MSDALEEEQFMPVVQGINLISDQPTTDHKALVIRLELGYVDYAHMEELVQRGITADRARLHALTVLRDQIKIDEAEPPYPLTLRDIEATVSRIMSEIMVSEHLLKTIKRPPR